MSIKVSCRTNLDGYKSISWPTEFCIVPEIGQRVMSLCRQKSLKIVDITHCMKRVSSNSGASKRRTIGVIPTSPEKAYLEIELGK